MKATHVKTKTTSLLPALQGSKHVTNYNNLSLSEFLSRPPFKTACNEDICLVLFVFPSLFSFAVQRDALKRSDAWMLKRREKCTRGKG